MLLTRARSVFSHSLRRLSTIATTKTTTAEAKPKPKTLNCYGYILAPDNLLPGMKILNTNGSDSVGMRLGMLDPLSQPGNSMPLSSMRIGTLVHAVEHRPGEGAKYVRAAGTSAKILRLGDDGVCVLRMPSGVEKFFNSRCRATIGRVSNPDRKHLKLRKAGQSRWLGRRPVVRGVAMNPIDHPHGGGEGKAGGGTYHRFSRSPWGKPAKCGYKTVKEKNHVVRRGSAETRGKRKAKKA